MNFKIIFLSVLLSIFLGVVGFFGIELYDCRSHEANKGNINETVTKNAESVTSLNRDQLLNELQLPRRVLSDWVDASTEQPERPTNAEQLCLDGLAEMGVDQQEEFK